MNYNNVKFYISVGDVDGFTSDERLKSFDGAEFAFSGHSNVGKSTLINKIFERKALARVSATPGKTATINFFECDGAFFADLPGYGYAKVSKAEQTRWSKLINGYITGEREISLVFQLIDIRHKPTADDINMINYLIDAEQPFVIVFTKSDKLSKLQREKRMESFADEIPQFEDIVKIEFSSKTGEGVCELRALIEEIAKDYNKKEDEMSRFLYDNYDVNEKGHLTISGADAVDIANEYGTPVCVIDEDVFRNNCRRFKNSMDKHYGRGLVCFASKALLCKEIARWINDEGLGIDVVSEGELYTALAGGISPDKICYHGSNKTDRELRYALSENVHHIVVDNLTELKKLDGFAKTAGKTADIMFRVKPGIDAHTHDLIKTGQIDSKFGFALETGEAFDAVKAAIASENINLVGLHCHIGSQIFDIEAFELAAETMLIFIAKIKNELGYEITALNLGGGFGIKYLETDDPAPFETYMERVSKKTSEVCKALGINQPFIMIEPGRSIAGPAGTTLYTVGAVKNIPGIRTYVSVDGGMTDNPRYSLYKAKYTIENACKAAEEKSEIISLAGRCCETDLLGEHMSLQKTEPGDVIAMFSTGAYVYAMASNYNMIPKLPLVAVKDGKARLIVKRQTIEQLTANDL
jgi:diaminopimelate decarboxylase